MGLFSCLMSLYKKAFLVFVVAVIFVYIPGIPPHVPYVKVDKVTPAMPLEGKLALNNKLDDVEIWHKGDLFGPEAFAHYNGQLYTTLHGGDVVKLVGNHITPVARFGKPCKAFHQEELCGRPLGMNFDEAGNLFVADAYYGIFKVDVNTGKHAKLVSVDQEIEGAKPKLPNSIAIAKNGDLYWTDSSTQFKLHDGLFDTFSDGSGRLIHYDAKTKKNTVLLSGLNFANGVALSTDETFVLVCETNRNRILRYYLKGPRKGDNDVFIDGLPGMPDNLKPDGRGGFLVPLVVPADQTHPVVPQMLAGFPWIRKFISRTLGVVQLTFDKINQVYPNDFSERAVHFVGHFRMSSYFMFPERLTILRVSQNGDITDSAHSLNKKVSGISELHVYKDTLYLGSPFNDYIGRIPLSKLGWDDLKQVEATTQKPTTTTPRPTTTPKPAATTTTPRPTTTTPKPTTTTPKPTTATPKQTTTPRPATTPKPTQAATQKPKPTQPPPPPQQAKEQPKAVPVKEAPKPRPN